jgi:aminoglycoside/choline kinase family phosphotransferase
MDAEIREAQTRDHALLEAIAKDRLGRDLERIEPMLAGLGTRRFHRLFFSRGEPKTLIARFEADAPPAIPAGEEAPPAWLPEPPLEPLRTFLEEAGIPVPASTLHDPEHALDLLEDVGDCTIGMLPRDEREARTREACALLPQLQALAPPSRTTETEPNARRALELEAFARPYDRRLVATKAWKWLHWTIPLILDRPATAEEVRETTALFDWIADLAEAAPKRLSHRDFKAENLHWVSGPHPRLVMIDVQGAFMAPPEYDLVCILYDLQVELDEGFIWDVFDRTRRSLPDAPDPDIARERFDALAIARVCKDVAHVAHACQVRGDRRRCAEIPRGLELVQSAAGRRPHTFPGARALSSVIEALTARLESTDSPEE